MTGIFSAHLPILLLYFLCSIPTEREMVYRTEIPGWQKANVSVIFTDRNMLGSMDLVPMDYSLSKYRWVAVSGDLLKGFPYGTVMDIRGISPEIYGAYVVKHALDGTGKAKNSVKLLIDRSNSLYGDWNAEIRKSTKQYLYRKIL